MPNYKYKAIAQDGTIIGGVIDAYDEFEAVDRIKQNSRVVTSISTVDDPDKQGFSLNMTIGTPKVKEKTIALMCSQFAIVLKAGMPIVRCVELIAGQTTDAVLKKILEQVAEDVATGYGLAQSFENKGAKILPNTFIETIRSGEESGTLEIAFAKLQVYFEKSAKTKDKVKSAMMYPAFLAVIAVVVIAIVLMVAMPVFVDMLVDSGNELPAITVILINLSNFFSKYWVAVLGIIALLVAVLKLWSTTEKGRMALAKAQLKLPALGRVAQMKGASQLANTMSTMLASGLSIVRSVSICAKTLDNYHLSTQLAASVTLLEEGKPLGQCLEKCGCFPDLLVEMVTVGEETGSLESTLDTIGEYYDSETTIASERALSTLQPAITIVMGVVIGFIVMALYMPMFSMYG